MGNVAFLEAAVSDMVSGPSLPRRSLGRTRILVPPIGFGAFKIGRALGAKYPQPYEVPSDAAAAAILDAVIALDATLIDTAPAYGLSEERIGRHLSARRGEFVLSTKVGETFVEAAPGMFESRHDFTPLAIGRSVEASVERLRGPVELLFVHADARDGALARDRSVVDALEAAKARGLARAIGFSGKSADGARAALGWADAVMVEYHLDDRSAEGVIAEAAQRGVGVLVKKALASGRLPAAEAIRFVLANDAVDSVIVGGLDARHFAANVAAARSVRGGTA